MPEERHANAAYAAYNIDNAWYTDTSSTDNITSELNKLSMRERYNGTNQIHTASGAGMTICHVGQSVLHAPSRDLILNNVLHVPKAKKILVSIHQFTSDNNAYLEFHPTSFLSTIRQQRKQSLDENVRVASIPSRHLLPMMPGDMLGVPQNPQLRHGTTVLVTHRVP